MLGIQWLSTLGTVKWEFKRLQMECQHEGRSHLLRGMQDKRIRVMNGTQMFKSKCDAIQLCMLQVPTATDQPLEWGL